MQSQTKRFKWYGKYIAALLTGGTRRELLEDCMDAELLQYALGLVL